MRKFSLSSASNSAGVVRDHGVVLRALGNRIWVRPPPPPPPPARPPQPRPLATATSVSTFPPPTSAMVIRVQFVQWSYENHPYRACSYAAFTAEDPGHQVLKKLIRDANAKEFLQKLSPVLDNLNLDEISIRMDNRS